ncbi:MAG: leucine-rich repeat protein [Paludibacteraceae bacterium]|jgi:hypothetical protein|nr:leucine-rich repeat protein [Paludibacteraceae bacterium]HPS10508.1 leucine-rich repeat protein [Paludibacteraceae bacterium]
MKTYLLFVTICISISFVHAQVPKTVTVNTPGTLESVLTSTELINTTSLVVKGKINELDFLTMRIKMSALVSVDISETDVMESTRNGYTYPANEIPKYALSENIKIKAIKLPSSANSIGVGAFRSCTGLRSFTNAVSVTTIQHEAFYNCKSLKTVEIPAKVKTIQYEAFYQCDSLTLVNISASLVSFERNCFNFTASFTVDPKNLYFSALDGILYNKNKTTLLQCPNSKSGNFSIASSVVTIGANAFRKCEKITGVIFSPVLDSIKDFSFIGCTGLTELNFPSSLRYIGNNAFFSCTNLKTVGFSDAMEFIGDDAFNECALIDSIVMPSKMKRIGSCAFRYCTALKAVRFVAPSSLNEIGILTFQACTGLTSVSIPNSVKKLGGGAFQDCTNLKEVSLPSSLPNISISLFKGCEKLTSVDIPSSVSKISDYAFLGCYSLSNLLLPTGVDSIGYRAFGGCTKLKYANIPATVKFIGAEAYLNCKALSVLYVYTQTPVDLSSSDNVFGGFSKSKCNLMVPSVSKNLYKTANQWKDFTLVGDIDVLLSEIKVNGIDVPTFHSMVFDYSMILPPETSIYVISANSLYPNATVKITQVASVPGAATIEVTGIDNTTKQIHTVYLAIADEHSNIVTINSGVKTGDKILMIVDGTPGQAMVDYGDGILKTTDLFNYSGFTPYISFFDATSPVDNPTIKVYAKSLKNLFVTALNKAISLDVSKNSGLEILICSDNQLTTLDVSKNTAIIQLECNNNKLRSIKCSAENTALKEIYCKGNQLSECGLDSLFYSLPFRSYENNGTLYVGDNPGTLISKTEIALNKFWSTDISGDGSGCTHSGIDVSETVDLVLYPNPGNGRFNLCIPEGQQLHSLTVVNSLGKTVRNVDISGQDSEFTFDLSDQPNGIYLLRCSTNKGLGCRKLVKY